MTKDPDHFYVIDAFGEAAGNLPARELQARTLAAVRASAQHGGQTVLIRDTHIVAATVRHERAFENRGVAQPQGRDCFEVEFLIPTGEKTMARKAVAFDENFDLIWGWNHG